VRVGLLTTWNTRCGIAEYSRYLVSALRRRGDVDVTVFGSRNYGSRAVRPYEDFARPTFDVQMWNPEWRLGLDVEAVLEHDLDVLHIEYSNLFYNRRRLVELIRRFPGVTALTYHDKCVSRAFPYPMVDLLFAHREDVGRGPRRFIPQGIDVHRPVVKTFGLGKARTDVIAELCEQNGWEFNHSFGETRWLESDDLYRWLRDCDAIVLWYEEDLSSGGSAAAPLAIATRRPVFVNDTEWFRDLPDRTATLRRVGSIEELEAGLRDLLRDDYASERSWDRVANAHVDSYREALESGGHARGARLRSKAFAMLDHKPFSRAKRRLGLSGGLGTAP
jgi:hypothetical protein